MIKTMPRYIVAIGGGDIRTRGTSPIDREIIRLSNKKHPRLLFIPTASSDSERYWRHVQEDFGRFLKCKTDVLFLIEKRTTREMIRKKILGSDVIYVGGGNTLLMMRVWRRLGLIGSLDSLMKTELCCPGSVRVRSAGLILGIPIPCRFIVRKNGSASM